MCKIKPRAFIDVPATINTDVIEPPFQDDDTKEVRLQPVVDDDDVVLVANYDLPNEAVEPHIVVNEQASI